MDEMKLKVYKARYIACTIDKVTITNNGSWMPIHLHIIGDWVHVPLLMSLQQVHIAPTTTNLVPLIMEVVVAEVILMLR